MMAPSCLRTATMTHLSRFLLTAQTRSVVVIDWGFMGAKALGASRENLLLLAHCLDLAELA